MTEGRHLRLNSCNMGLVTVKISKPVSLQKTGWTRFCYLVPLCRVKIFCGLNHFPKVPHSISTSDRECRESRHVTSLWWGRFPPFFMFAGQNKCPFKYCCGKNKQLQVLYWMYKTLCVFWPFIGSTRSKSNLNKLFVSEEPLNDFLGKRNQYHKQTARRKLSS